MVDSGCMTAWVDDTSHGWSISKGMGDNFEKKWISLDSHETATWGD